MNSSGWSIAHRLGAGFVALLVIFVAFTFVTQTWNARSERAHQDYVERILPRAAAADTMERALLYVAIAARNVVIRPDAESLEASRAAIARARTALRTLQELEPLDAAQTPYDRLAPDVEAYLDEAARLVAERRRSATPAGAEQTLALLRERALAVVRAIATRQDERARAALAAAEDARQAAAQGQLWAAGLALLVFAGIAFMLTRAIRSPAGELVRVAEALGEGNWQPALALAPADPAQMHSTRDELRKVGFAFGVTAAALERREQRLRADRTVTSAAGASLSRQQVAEEVLRAVCSHTGAEVGAIYALDETPPEDSRPGGSEARLVPIARHALAAEPAPLALGEGLPGEAAASRRTLVARGIPADSAFTVKLGYDAAPPRCVAAVPLAAHGELLGVLLAASLRDLDADAISFLEAAGGQLSIGLQNIRSHEQARLSGETIQAQNEELQAQNEEIQAQNEEIVAQNDQLKSQADELRRQTAALRDADRRRADFQAVLAHELRNPLAAIVSSLHVLDLSDGAPQARAKAVIGRQSRLLARLVEDLLDTARIENGKVRLQLEPLDLAEVVRDCAQDYTAAARDAGSSLALDIPQAAVPVRGDRVRLCQIVGNLVDNAIKFGRGSPVRVSLSLPPGADEALLTVTDRGIGIDPDMLERLFQPFSQAEAGTDPHRRGLGLGLSLVKNLAELHGGRVEVRSGGRGTGAEFSVRLPVAGAAARSAAQPAPTVVINPPRTAPRRILIIEDNPDTALSLSDALAPLGHEVRVEVDPLKGIEAARDFRPDVLLCDIGLPSIDGYEVARRFRADEQLKSTFLIAVTGYAQPADQEKAARAGFDRHFAKPADLERLRELLSEPTPGRPASA